MKYLLDTNICIYIINKKPASILRKLIAIKPHDVCLSSVTLAELRFGIEKSQHKTQNRNALDEFLMPFTIAAFDDEAATHYGEIRSHLEKHGKTIGPLDMLIAAHARSLNLTMVTHNIKEFSRVPNLKVADWN